MSLAVLWLRENELVLGELSELDGVYSFQETAMVEAPIPLDPILTKSEPAIASLAAHFNSLVASYPPSDKQIEVWLPPQWGIQLIIPIPSLPAKDIIEQLTWEVRKQLQTDLDYYLYLYRDRGDGQYEVRLMRPAIVAFWKKFFSDAGYTVNAVRLAEQGQPYEDIIAFDFKSLNVISSAVSNIEPITEEIEFSLSVHKKVRLAKQIFLLAAVVIVVSSGVYYESTHLHPKPRKPSNLIAFNATPPPKMQPTPVASGSDTAHAKPIPVPIPAPVTQASSIQEGSLKTVFLRMLTSSSELGTLELASLIPGQAVYQLITNHDGSDAFRKAWKSNNGADGDINTKYDASTRRLTVWLALPVFKPDPAFTIPVSKDVSVDASSANASPDVLLAAIAQWQSLPYRISIIPDGNTLRVVVVK